MSINKKIKRKKKALNKLVVTLGVMNKRTIKLSQEIDDLIIEKMRGVLA